MSVTVAAKDPDTPSTYSIDWSSRLVDAAPRETDVGVGVFVRAQFDTGFYYESTVAGRTARHYPIRWPRAAAETAQDGSVTWTCRHPDDATVPSVSSTVWTVPAGLTKESQTEDGFVTYITLSAGTDGVDYDVTCRMTPSSGNVIEQTITIPVRSQ